MKPTSPPLRPHTDLNGLFVVGDRALCFSWADDLYLFIDPFIFGGIKAGKKRNNSDKSATLEATLIGDPVFVVVDEGQAFALESEQEVVTARLKTALSPGGWDGNKPVLQRVAQAADLSGYYHRPPLEGETSPLILGLTQNLDGSWTLDIFRGDKPDKMTLKDQAGLPLIINPHLGYADYDEDCAAAILRLRNHTGRAQ